jgi:hypothetical protein
MPTHESGRKHSVLNGITNNLSGHVVINGVTVPEKVQKLVVGADWGLCKLWIGV